MSCSTYFAALFEKDVEKIAEMAQECLNEKFPWYTPSEREMWQYAIDKRLITPMCNIVSNGTRDVIPRHPLNRLYKDTSVSGEIPRIAGFPEKIIHSFDEFKTAFIEGLEDEEGDTVYFYTPDRKEYPPGINLDERFKGIKGFFEKNPEGIMYFN